MGLFDKVKEASAQMGAKAQEAVDNKLAEREEAKVAAAADKEEQNKLKEIFNATKSLGDLELDMENELFKVRHARSGMKKKDGAMKKLGKATAAVYTMGASVVIEKTMLQPDDRVFRFSELMDYELIEDDSQVTKGGLGMAAAGGILFGGVGAIVGSNTGKKKSKKVVESLYLKIDLNDIDFPCVFVPYITKSTKTSSGDYTKAMNAAQESISCLNIILKQLEAENTAVPTAAAEADPLEQVAQLKNLLDMGAITQEEFDTKKKELLGL